MSETAHQPRTGPVIFPRFFALPHAAIGVAYLAGYVLLDWVSFINPVAPYIDPWNPPTGLGFILVPRFGHRMIPFLFVAPVLSDFIARQSVFPWRLEFATSAIIGFGYSLALLFLLRPKTRFNPKLLSLRDLLLLLVTAAISAAPVAVSYVGIVIAAGFLPAQDFFIDSLLYWVGDVIGIVVIAPLGLLLLNREPLLKASVETAIQFSTIIFALLLVFGLSRAKELQLFYTLFVPIAWLAVRADLRGAAAGILVTQLGLIAGIRLVSGTAVDVTAFQLLMLVLATTGLVMGALVTERRRAEIQLRLHQDSLARFARLRSMGELAVMVAHEINQPLMAAGTYSRLVRDAVTHERNGDPSIAEIADKAATQVERASEIVRRLRALMKLDKSDRALATVGRIVNETVDMCQPEFSRSRISCRTNLQDDLPPVMVDSLQIEQVLLNLVRNAIEAIDQRGNVGGMITIEAKPVKSGNVELSVRDTGPGFADGQATVEFSLFATTKPQGVGIGLSLSRRIIEAHGGQLTAESDVHGAVVRFTLPAGRYHE